MMGFPWRDSEAVDFLGDSSAVAVEWGRRAGRGLAAGPLILVAWLRATRRTDPLPPRPVVVAAACLAAGCVVGRLVEPVEGSSLAGAWWIAAVAALGIWLWLARWRGPRAAAWPLAGAICCCGAAWSEAQFDLFRRDDLGWYLADSPAPVAVMGTVEESFRRLPVPTGDPHRAAAIGPSSECVVRVESFRAGSRWRTVSGRAAVIVDGEPPRVRVGDRIRVLGRGLRPAAALNPGEFDFRMRARAHRCLSIVRVASARCVRVMRATGWLQVARFVDELRERGVAVLETHISPARAPLAAALLLGSRESLPREEADDFLATGTVHILSISGLHVGLLSLALFKLLRVAMLPRGWSLVAVAVVTGAYMLLVRAETPVLRATLLVWLSCLAAAVGRRSPAINALAVAAIVVLAWRPAEVFSAGAQLSFLSTGVLVGIAAALSGSRQPEDPIDRLIERSRSPTERFLRRCAWQVWVAFVTGAAVWAATTPLVAAKFHVVSSVGLLVNVLVAPLVALAMAWGFLCLLAASVSTTLAAGCGAACDGMLHGIATVVYWAARVPAGHTWVAGPPDWWVAGWYAVLAATLSWFPAGMLRRPQTWAAVAGGWIGVGIVAGAAVGSMAAGDPPLRGVVAAVGHGCGIVLRTTEGRCLVFDAGRLGAPAAARRSMAAVLWSEGITRIDTLVISHADTDHFNAVPELLERFAVAAVVVPAALLTSESPAVRDLLERFRERGIPLQTVKAGDSFAVDRQCRVRVLHPTRAAADQAGTGSAAVGLRFPSREADNQTSLVMAVETAGRRWLLTGDIEGEALAGFIAGDPDSCDVLVAPHHGSRTSLPAGIAVATKPKVVLVSGGRNPSWPEVRAAYAAAAEGAAVLNTGGTGAIAVDADASGIAISRFYAGRWRPVE